MHNDFLFLNSQKYRKLMLLTSACILSAMKGVPHRLQAVRIYYE